MLSPPGFPAGLRVWSHENGRLGSAIWSKQTNASVITADTDFGPCLEIVTTDHLTKLRFMGKTPIILDAFLRVRAPEGGVGRPAHGADRRLSGNGDARVDRVDTSIADPDHTRMRNLQFEGNAFNGVVTYVSNPITLNASAETAAAVWSLPAQGGLPPRRLRARRRGRGPDRRHPQRRRRGHGRDAVRQHAPRGGPARSP